MNLKKLVENAPDNVKKSFIYRKHCKDSSIISPGEGNDYLFILISGSANVIMYSFSGTVLTFFTYQAYSCFGELELFNKNTKTFYIKSQTNCETISIPKNTVFEWMKLDFEFTKYLIEQLTEKLIKNSNAFINVSLLSIKDRLLNNIYSHYLANDLSILIKELICSETCIPLRSLNRAIVECKSDGFIDFKDKRFQILSISKLESHLKSLI
ncbi:Crp/Fnr family transcriptional regulator [Clostridium uliginosum]|uniref:cAMP-binding domain of CRP or a regulatory subunit of cAMP-dependent protein kinases n=1 Tax=Clostridium uliginosum TaxID=119641 RepID=A0A1I1R1L7_9CLOT|nr:Crp/Fnr family transcriptional regulator [Clostridium uliginosum]SFD25433.1 cAMP-binding domain of CRP or a regulatory subunit of cAMP-dependent protein kinases [Clostridium uliginosum]